MNINKNSILFKPKLLYSCIHKKLLTTITSPKILVYNSLTKQKENLNLKTDNVLYWYSCGPTVYDSAHIGHARYVIIL